jgi:hypothetical protein
MDPKPDKESEKHGDIVLLFEIIADSIYWQLCNWKSTKFGASFRAYHNFKLIPDSRDISVLLLCPPRDK